MINNYKNFLHVAIIQYPEQWAVYDTYFSDHGINSKKVLWIATTDSAYFFLEQKKVFFYKITDFYDYNDFYNKNFDQSYENLGKALKSINENISSKFPVLKKYDISFAEGSFYYLRTWCDSFETDIYEMQALKNVVSDQAVIYYMPSVKQDFTYNTYPLHVNRSLEEILGLVFEKERLCALECFKPKSSLVNFSQDFESKKINALFGKDKIFPDYITRIKKKLIYLTSQLLVEKKYLAMGIDRDYLPDIRSFDFFEDYIAEIQNLIVDESFECEKFIQNIDNYFAIGGINYYICIKHIIQKTLEAFIISAFKVIFFYHHNEQVKKWKAIFSLGFMRFESQILAKLFKFYGKKIICTHHGSLGILKDKLNHYIEYPFVTDYVVWGIGVKNQLEKEYNFKNIRIHNLGSIAVSNLEKRIVDIKKKNYTKSLSNQPVIIFLLQTNNYKVRLTLDHPPDIIDFIQQRELISLILNIPQNFDFIIKGHPTTDFYICSPLRFLFKTDNRVHYISRLPLENFLARGTHFITDRPSTSLLQAMFVGLKCYCLINSEFYIQDFIKCLENDDVLFKDNEALVTALHTDLNGKRPAQQQKLMTIENYCSPYKGSIEEILRS